jgi:plastocyanin
MKKVGVMIFVFLLLAAGSYYFFLNYPATTYAILGINHSTNSTLTQINTSILSNLTSVNISTNNSESLNLTPIDTTTSSSVNTSINDSITSNVLVTTSSSTNSSTYNVTIINFAFYPNNLTIHKGDTVIWINQDGMLHHAVSDEGNEIDSSDLILGLSYAHTFGNTGNFSYHDFMHPSLTGTIIVE